METRWFVNGRPGTLDPADRGLAYGDGLFETMAAADGRIRWLDLHLDRLLEGCGRLGIPPPARGTLATEIAAQCPPAGRSVVKLILTRGTQARGYRPAAGGEPTRILGISSWSGYPPGHYTDGIRVRTLTLRLGRNPRLAGLKTLNRLEQVLAARELDGGDAEEGIVLDSEGLVIGAVSGNVFAVRGRELATPDVARCGIAGVMRRVVLDTAARAGLAARPLDLTPVELSAADEIFVTNALAGIRPVGMLDGAHRNVGTHTRALMQLVNGEPDA